MFAVPFFQILPHIFFRAAALRHLKKTDTRRIKHGGLCSVIYSAMYIPSLTGGATVSV